MSENMGLHAQITADSNNFTQNLQKAYRALYEFSNETTRLKAEQKALQANIASLTNQIAKQGEKLAAARQRLREMTAAGKEDSKAAQDLKTKIDGLEKSIQRATSRMQTYDRKLHDNADTQSQLAAQAAAATKQIDQQTQAYAKQAKQGTDTASQLKSAFTMLKGLALGYAGKTLFDALVGSNADFEQRMTSFEVLLGSAEQAQAMMDDLEAFAAKTPLQLPDVTKATQLLLSYGVAQEDVLTRMSQLGDLAQGNAEKLDRVSLAYGQMLAKGKVTGEELRQMTEAGVPLVQALADVMGVTTAELSKLLETGSVGIPELNRAIEEMTSEGGKFYGMLEKQSQTMAGLWSTLGDNAALVARDVGEETFGYLKEELQGLMDTMAQMEADGSLANMADTLGSGIATVVRSVGNLLKLLWDMKEVLLSFGASFAIWKTFTTVLKTQTAVMNGWKAIQQANLTLQQMLDVALGKSVILRNTETGAISVETAEVAKNTVAKEGSVMVQSKLNGLLGAGPWLAAGAAVAILTTAVELLTVSYEEQMDKVRDLSQAHEETVSELDEIKSKLEENQQKIDEINREPLNITNKETLLTLQNENAELERQIALKESLEGAQKRELGRETVELLGKGKSSEYFQTTTYGAASGAFSKGDWWSGIWRGLLSFLQPTYGSMPGVKETSFLTGEWMDITEETDLMIVSIQTLQEELANLDQSTESGQKRAQELKQRMDELDGGLASNISTLEEYRKNLDLSTEEGRKYYQVIGDLINRFMDIIPAQEAFSAVFDAADFQKSKEELLALAKAGEITPEVIESYEEFRSLMEATGMTAEEVMGLIVASSMEESQAVADTAKQASDLADTMESLQSRIDILNAAQASYNETGYLSADMLRQLTENDLLQYLDFANGKLSVNADALYDQGEAAKAAALASLQQAAAQDLQNLAIGNTDGLSEIAKSAIQELGNNAETAGNQAATAAGGFLAFAGSLDAMLKAAAGEAVDPDAFLPDAQAVVNRYKNLGNLISSISIGGGSAGSRGSGSSKSSGGRSSSSSGTSSADNARKERVTAYKEAVKEEMLIDERWNDQRRKRGEITEREYLANLGTRIARYRAHAEEVLHLDYLTEEERSDLHKEYIRKAEDLDDSYFDLHRSILQDEYAARKEASEEWLSLKEKEGNFEEVVAGWQRVRDYMEAYYQAGAWSAEDYAKEVKSLYAELEDAALASVEAITSAYQKGAAQSEKYIAQRNKLGDWGTDSEEAALSRMLDNADQAYAEAEAALRQHYDNGLLTQESYNAASAKLAQERVDAIEGIWQKQYDLAFQEAQQLITDTEAALLRNYELDKTFEMSVAYRELDTKLAEAEASLAAVTRKQDAAISSYEARMRALDEQLEAYERSVQDEDDETKRKRLSYLVEYEHDDDNRRALQKQLDALDEQIADKLFRRGIEDEKERLKQEQETIVAQYDMERAQAEALIAHRTQLEQRRIDEINAYYEQVMAPESLARQMYETLMQDESIFGAVGDLIGGQMVDGIDQQFRGWLAGALQSLEGMGLALRGTSTQGLAGNIPLQSYGTRNTTINMTVNGNASPAMLTNSARKMANLIDLGVET